MLSNLGKEKFFLFKTAMQVSFSITATLMLIVLKDDAEMCHFVCQVLRGICCRTVSWNILTVSKI